MAAGDTVEVAEKPPRKTYASAQIHERRARIISEALALIIETGSTGFTIQELSRRAEVAPRTLYYGFSGKEGVIESAVLEHYSELSRRNGLTASPPYAGAVLNALDVAIAEIFRVPNYARAMVDIYFSPSANSRIVAALRRISSGFPAIWFRAERQAGRLQPWAEDALFLQQLSDLQYGAIHTWSVREIGDHELVRRLRANFRTMAHAVLNDPGRREFDDVLDTLNVEIAKPEGS